MPLTHPHSFFYVTTLSFFKPQGHRTLTQICALFTNGVASQNASGSLLESLALVPESDDAHNAS